MKRKCFITVFVFTIVQFVCLLSVTPVMAEDVEPITITITYDKESVNIGEEITATYSITGGNGEYKSIIYAWEDYSGGTWINGNDTYLNSKKGTVSHTPEMGTYTRLYMIVGSKVL